MMRISRSRTGLVLGALLILQAVLFLLLLREHRGALLDDAYISFRYAARWAAGEGLTWNDDTAVEGFSNPLWTLTLGATARLGPPPESAAPVLGWFFLAGMAGLLAWTGAALGLSPGARILLVGGAALDPGLAQWSGSGLETSQTAFLVAACLGLLGRGAGRFRDLGPGAGLALGGVAALLALSRPEGGLWALGIGAWLVWGAWARGGLLAGWCLGFLPPVLGYALFRWQAYGALLPNTFHAKVEPGTAGLALAGSNLAWWAGGHAVLILGAAAALVASRGRPTAFAGPPRLGWLAAGWVALQAAFVVAAGGDWMGNQRFLAPLAPAAALAAALAADRLRGRVSRRLAVPLVAISLAGHLALTWETRDALPTYTREGEVLGRWLRGVAGPDDLLAVTAAGAVPYFSGLRTYDVLGINDPAVAGRRTHRTGAWSPGHNRYDLDALLAAEPQWIVWDFGVSLNRIRIRQLRSYQGDIDALDYRRALLARADFREAYRIDTDAPRETQNSYTVFRRR